MGRVGEGLTSYYKTKIEEQEIQARDRQVNLRRLQAQRNELNTKGTQNDICEWSHGSCLCTLYSEQLSCLTVRLLREELQLLQEPGSYVGEVVKIMGKNKILVKVNPEGKYVVDLDKSIDIAQVTPGARVALKNDSYTLHYLLPTKVWPLPMILSTISLDNTHRGPHHIAGWTSS